MTFYGDRRAVSDGGLWTGGIWYGASLSVTPQDYSYVYFMRIKFDIRCDCVRVALAPFTGNMHFAVFRKGYASTRFQSTEIFGSYDHSYQLK